MIKRLFIKAKNNELVNTSFYTGMATSLAMISGLVVNKVIALTIGPSGIAMVSQFKNFISISTSIGTAGIQKGVVKYVAEYRGDESELSDILSTSLRVAIVPSVIIGISIFFLSDFLSNYLLETGEYSFVFKLFGLTVTLFSLNVLSMSILNGTGEIKKLVWVKMSNSVFALIVTSMAAYLFSLTGALVALAISQSIVLVITIYFISKSEWFKASLFHSAVNWKYVKLLLGFSLMAISSMVVPPFVKIEIRNFIIDSLSVTAAGYWDATFMISTAYLNVVTTTLGIYYLPKLSNLTKIEDLRKEIWNGYKIILPALAILLIIVYLFREQVISILYSKEFIEMEFLFIPQLLGDFFKISSFILSYLMLAKAKVYLFISTELVFSVITYVLSIYLISQIGLIGVVWAHAIKYLLYLLLMILLFKKYLFK